MKTPNTENQSKRLTSWFFTFLWLALALLLRWQVIEPRWIPSGSMLPTLKVKDRILVEKIRPRFQKLHDGHLNIGSIVVFSPPKELIQAGYDKDSALIKRVIGLPGDKIEVHKGKLIRNGEVVTENWRAVPMKYEMNQITIPENSIWVLGDNRNNSLDSHFWGPLPEENLLGTAVWRYWPLKRFGPIRFPTQKNNYSNELTAIRS